MIKVYGIKNCDSVKKALFFFKKHDVSYEFQDFKTEPVRCEKVSFWLEHVTLKQLFNARSTTYRNLKLKERNLSSEEQIAYLCQENLLIKRPVIEFNNTLTVGFNEDNYKGTFL